MRKLLNVLMAVLMLSSLFFILSEESAANSDLSRKELPDSIKDGDWLNDGAKIIFSENTKLYYNSWLEGNVSFYKYRLFVKDKGSSEKEQLTVISGDDNPSTEDYIAPLVSPDGSKIAFVQTRSDHLCILYVMDWNGTNISNLRSLGILSDSLIYAWLSDKEIVFQRSARSAFSYDMVAKDVSIVDIATGDTETVRGMLMEIFSGKFATRIKEATQDLPREGYSYDGYRAYLEELEAAEAQESQDSFIQIILIIIFVIGLIIAGGAVLMIAGGASSGGSGGGWTGGGSGSSGSTSRNVIFQTDRIDKPLIGNDRVLRSGNRTVGSLSDHPYRPNRQVIKDSSGKGAGSISQHPYRNNTQVIEDNRGRKIGSISTDLLGNRVIRDSTGRKTGTITKDARGRTIVKKEDEED